MIGLPSLRTEIRKEIRAMFHQILDENKSLSLELEYRSVTKYHWIIVEEDPITRGIQHPFGSLYLTDECMYCFLKGWLLGKYKEKENERS